MLNNTTNDSITRNRRLCDIRSSDTEPMDIELSEEEHSLWFDCWSVLEVELNALPTSRQVTASTYQQCTEGVQKVLVKEKMSLDRSYSDQQ